MTQKYVVGLVLISVVTPACEKTESGSSEQALLPAQQNALELEVLSRINVERFATGAAPLRLNRELTRAARWFARHAVEDNKPGFCSHTDGTQRGPGERIASEGYPVDSFGENVVCGITMPQGAVTGWMNSEGHKANMLNTVFREVGIGYYQSETTGRGYVVADFATDNHYAPVVINKEETSTTSTDIDLYIYDSALDSGVFRGAGPATQMMISNDASFKGATWEVYTINKRWTLEAGTGFRTVYVKLRDAIGRTAVANDSIYLGTDFDASQVSLDLHASIVEEGLSWSAADMANWPQMQLSLSWTADETNQASEVIGPHATSVQDAEAIGGAVARVPANAKMRIWQASEIPSIPMVAYVRWRATQASSQTKIKIRVTTGGASHEIVDQALEAGFHETAVPFHYLSSQTSSFLIFDMQSDAEFDFDAIRFFTDNLTPTSPFTWSVPETKYRSRGLLVRGLDAKGRVTPAYDAEIHADLLTFAGKRLETGKVLLDTTSVFRDPFWNYGPIGQSFTWVDTSTIYAVDLCTHMPPERIEIREGAGVNGNVLAQSETKSWPIANDASCAGPYNLLHWVRFILKRPLQLQSHQVATAVLTSTTGIGFAMHSGDVYPGGQLYKPNYPEGWPNQDMRIRFVE